MILIDLGECAELYESKGAKIMHLILSEIMCYVCV